MISTIEIFGIISIGFALNVLRIAAKGIVKNIENQNWENIPPKEEIESFVEIPIEHLVSNIDTKKGQNLEELKEKIKKFKERNRFYTI